MKPSTYESESLHASNIQCLSFLFHFDMECPNAHMLLYIKSTIKSAHTPPTTYEGISYIHAMLLFDDWLPHPPPIIVAYVKMTINGE